MSETVERRLVELLDHPTESPYGNPIPGLDELGETAARRGVHGRRRAAVEGGRPPTRAACRAPHLRGDAEGRDADERPAPGRRAARQDRSRWSPPPRACWSAPAARPPRSCPRRPTTSSCASSEAVVRVRRRRASRPARSRNSLQPTSSLYVASVVAAGRAAVDDHHRRAGLGRPADEPQAAHHGQRRAGHQQRAVGRRRARRRRRSSARPAAAGRSRRRRPRRGLSTPPHASQPGTTKSAVSSRSTSPSGRARRAACRVGEAGVELGQPLVQRRPRGRAPGSRGRRPRRSGRAARPARRDPARSCRPSTFWVISSSGSSRASAWWPALGSAPLHPAPAEVAARPVPLPGLGAGHELLVGHRHPRRASPGRGSRGCRSRWRARRRSAPPAAGSRSSAERLRRPRRSSSPGRPGGERGSSGVAQRRPGPRLLGLDLAVLRRRGGDQVVEQVLGEVGDLARPPGRRPPGWPGDGLVVPLTLRTYCSAAAVTSSRVAGGSKLFSGRMLRHMRLRVRRVAEACDAPRSVTAVDRGDRWRRGPAVRTLALRTWLTRATQTVSSTSCSSAPPASPGS